MNIAKGHRIRLKVRLGVVNGDELEKSVVEYIHGGGTMLPGLEQVLHGLTEGDKREGVIKAENAFGDPSFQRDKVMSRKEFPEDTDLKVGVRFTAKGADVNQEVVLQIAAVDGDTVKVQLRHPLADKDIEYDVEVLSVTDPSPPPLPPDALGAQDTD